MKRVVFLAAALCATLLDSAPSYAWGGFYGGGFRAGGFTVHRYIIHRYFYSYSAPVIVRHYNYYGYGAGCVPGCPCR